MSSYRIIINPDIVTVRVLTNGDYILTINMGTFFGIMRVQGADPADIKSTPIQLVNRDTNGSRTFRHHYTYIGTGDSDYMILKSPDGMILELI